MLAEPGWEEGIESKKKGKRTGQGEYGAKEDSEES